MDFPGLAQVLTSFGPAGIIIGYLLWRQRDLEARLEASQNAMVAMLEKATKEVTAALVASTEAMRANNAIQDAAGKSAAALASAVSHLGQKLEHLDDTIERIDRERN